MFTPQLYKELDQLPRTVDGMHLKYSGTVTLSKGAILELRFWYRMVYAWNGYPLRPGTVTAVLCTDIRIWRAC